MKPRVILLSVLILFFTSCEKLFDSSNNVKDADGNNYDIVIIGDQTWMAENLRTTTYNDGTPIEYIEDWDIHKGRYCWYDHDEDNKKPYGALYNWDAVNTGKLAPEGWRVATLEDWEELKEFLGGKLIAGGKMKKRGNEIWEEPNKLVDPDCGFNAYPSGFVYQNQFSDLKSETFWWTSTEITGNGFFYGLINNSTSLQSSGGSYPGNSFLSVRCIKE
jgi:uncharacterized protein (TIGR02145 family)